MRRIITTTVTAGLTLGTALAVPAHAGQATRVECSGQVAIRPGQPQVREVPGGVVLTMPFTGTHTYCDPTGTSLTGQVAGTLVEHVARNGRMTMRFDEVMTTDGGSIEWRGAGSGSTTPEGLPIVTRGHVSTAGRGSGELAGMSAHGGFWTDPVTGGIADQVTYVYRCRAPRG